MITLIKRKREKMGIADIPIINKIAGLGFPIPIIMIKQIGKNIVYDLNEKAVQTKRKDQTELMFYRDGGKKEKPDDKMGALLTNSWGKIVRGYIFFKTKDDEYLPVPANDLSNELKNLFLPVKEDTKARIALKLREKYIKYKVDSKLKEIAQILWPMSILITVIALIVFWTYVFPGAAEAGIAAASRIAEVGTIKVSCPP